MRNSLSEGAEECVAQSAGCCCLASGICIGSKVVVTMAFSSLIFLPKNISFGLGFPSLAVFLQAARAEGKSSAFVFRRRYLAALTAASAWPLERGLYGEEVS